MNNILTNGHKIMWDHSQFVIWHPVECKHRGSVYDRHKTFHGHWQVDDFLADCNLDLPAEVREQIMAISEGLRDRLRHRR